MTIFVLNITLNGILKGNDDLLYFFSQDLNESEVIYNYRYGNIPYNLSIELCEAYA